VKRALFALAAIGLMGAAAPPPFRLGTIGVATEPCAAVNASAPTGQKAYFNLLSKRLERPVLNCSVASAAEGAVALAAGKIDMIALDPASYATIRSVARATMTVRPAQGLTRVPVVFAVKGGGQGSPQSLKGRTIAFGGSSLPGLTLPRQVLAQQGFGPDLFGNELIAGDEVAALAAVRAGKADAVALQVAAWQRQCRGASPTDRPCADLKIVWRARPEADKAFVVRRDMSDQERYRLIGIHMAMHLEDKPAFAWAAAQFATDSGDFEPAEAEALTTARLP